MPTKEDFVLAYKKFPPSRREMFFMKYISLHSLHSNFILEIFIILIFFLPFIIEIIFYTLEYPAVYKLIPTLIYICGFFIFGIYWSLIWYKKKQRFKKIREHLGISKKEYKKLVDAYFYHRYPTTKDYIKYNCNSDKNNSKKC